jgi:hypothetical protein
MKCAPVVRSAPRATSSTAAASRSVSQLSVTSLLGQLLLVLLRRCSLRCDRQCLRDVGAGTDDDGVGVDDMQESSYHYWG